MVELHRSEVIETPHFIVTVLAFTSLGSLIIFSKSEAIDRDFSVKNTSSIPTFKKIHHLGEYASDLACFE